MPGKEGLQEEDEAGNEEEDEEKRLVGNMELSDKWNEGKIEVNINRCCGCAHHYNYSRHSEDEFVSMFNDIGDAI